VGLSSGFLMGDPWWKNIRCAKPAKVRSVFFNFMGAAGEHDRQMLPTTKRSSV
jgi:hypothetical protein